jgi:AcrR family transcriptional regulator
MATRLTRSERKEQIRADLIAAAKDVFLRRGYHQASLEEISAEAGWSKGAIFSNFAGKDDLFMAVLEAHNQEQHQEQSAQMRAGGSLAGGLAFAGRMLADVQVRVPGWTPLLVQFWTHASHSPDLRKRVAAAHEDLLDQYAMIISELAARDGLEFVVPAKEVARSASSLVRGLALERLLDPATVSDQRLEELFSAHVLSFTRPRVGSE